MNRTAMRWLVRGIAVSVFGLMLGGCASQPFDVKVSDFYGAEGYRIEYHLTPGQIVTIVQSDRPDVGTHQVYQANLSDSQRKSLEQYFQQFPLQSLHDRYVDARSSSGIQLTIDIAIAGRGSRTVRLANTIPPNLRDLCDRINRLLPQDYQIGESRSTAPDKPHRFRPAQP